MDVDPFNIPRFLAVLPLFSDLSPAELDRAAEGCQVRRLARGATIFRYGEPCEEFHVVVTGRVKLFAISMAGQEKVIIPGDPEREMEVERMRNGIPLLAPVVADLEALSNKFKVPL